MSILQAQAAAPGKIIVTGEYSLMHQALAIALPAAMTTECRVFRSSQAGLSIHSLNATMSTSARDLNNHLYQIRQRYHRFQQQALAASEILPSANDLVMALLGLAQETIKRPLSHLHIDIKSHIPMGSGLGSSAALASALLQTVLASYNYSINKTNLLKLVNQSEQYAHGDSGGLDAYLSVYPRPTVWHKGKPLNTNLTPAINNHWQLINSGSPQSSTAECVERVKQQFKSSDAIWASFRQLSQRFVDCLTGLDSLQPSDQLRLLIKQNHQLLCRLGVVPKKVQKFVKEIEKIGAAAKITGAGAVDGDQAGILLCYGVSTTRLEEVGRKYLFSLI